MGAVGRLRQHQALVLDDRFLRRHREPSWEDRAPDWHWVGTSTGVSFWFGVESMD